MQIKISVKTAACDTLASFVKDWLVPCTSDVV